MSDFGKEIEGQRLRLWRYARALTKNDSDSEDLVQTTLVRALIFQHRFDGTSLRSWLFTILHNCYVNEVRKSVKLPLTSIDAFEDWMPHALRHAPSQLANLTMRDYHAAMKKLPKEQRDAIELIALDGLNYDDAAKLLNVPVGTIRSRLSRGRARLHSLMSEGETVKKKQLMSDVMAEDHL